MKKQLERIEDYALSLERAILSEDEQALLMIGGSSDPITVENNCSCANAVGPNCSSAGENNCQCGHFQG